MPRNDQTSSTAGAFAVVTSLFFAWGFITSLIDPLVAAVKGIFNLTDVQAQLSASAFFIAYGIMSFPAAALLSRLKSTTTVLIALGLMIAGCLLMLLAANIALYPLVLGGLFILASGITILQVASNPLAAVLGPPERAHFRLTFSQTFNSLGTFIGPYLGAVLFLKGIEVKEGVSVSEAARASALGGIDRAFFWIAGLIILLALFIWWARMLINRAEATKELATPRGIASTFAEALSSRWALFGGAAIFIYVGAEVAIGTQMALFLTQERVLDISLEDAGKMVSLYWGGAMVGRMIGTTLLTRVPATHLLAFNTAIAGALCLCVCFIGGATAGYAAIAIGLFNSIMFPLIFTLTLERSSASKEATSGFLCFSIIGGAALPPIVGLVSQQNGYAAAFIVPALCYGLLCAFALAAARTRGTSLGEEAITSGATH